MYLRGIDRQIIVLMQKGWRGKFKRVSVTKVRASEAILSKLDTATIIILHSYSSRVFIYVILAFVFIVKMYVCIFIHNKPSGFNDTTESTRQVFFRYR